MNSEAVVTTESTDGIYPTGQKAFVLIVDDGQSRKNSVTFGYAEMGC